MEILLMLIYITFNNVHGKLLNYERLILTSFLSQLNADYLVGKRTPDSQSSYS